MARTIYCEKLRREAPGLEEVPFPGELGQRIYDHISAEAWSLWEEESRRIIDEQELALGDPSARRYLRERMQEYLFEGADADTAAGVAPQEEVGGPRMVFCVKLGRRMPGLEAPPVGGDVGARIFENVSADAWQMWQDQSKILINHYGLLLADPEARQFLREQMEEYFFGEDARMPEGWAPAASGKGGGAAPAKK